MAEKTRLDGLSLSEILEIAFAEGREEEVKKALDDRLQIKKRIRAGEPVLDKAKRFNAQQGTIESEASAALKLSREKEDRATRASNLEFQQMDIGDPVLRRKRNPFGVVDAIKDLVSFRQRPFSQ